MLIYECLGRDGFHILCSRVRIVSQVKLQSIIKPINRYINQLTININRSINQLIKRSVKTNSTFPDLIINLIKNFIFWVFLNIILYFFILLVHPISVFFVVRKNLTGWCPGLYFPIIISFLQKMIFFTNIVF